MLCRLHTELAADGINCRDVLKGAAAVEGFAEHQRWEVLAELQNIYLKTLDELQHWDVQTARLVAIKQREIATEKDIVLLGTSDLNRAHRLMLDQIASRVVALIVAPKELANHFDEHGCLIPKAWMDVKLPLEDKQIERVDGPADQSEAVTSWLASLNGRYRADEITVGLPDARLTPQIERQLAQFGLAGHWAIGRRVVETGPCRLLKVAADYASRRRFTDLAALARHPDVFDWMRQKLERSNKTAFDPLTALDCFAKDHLPAQLDERRLAKDEKAADVREIFKAAEQLIKPLVNEARPLAQWSSAFRDVLESVYGGRDLDRAQPVDRCLYDALEHLRDALDSLAAVPGDLQPQMEARQACRLILDGLAGEGIAPPPTADAMELLGWLDLPLDDAPALIVTTFNDGWVPSTNSADTFLPNRLREALGLLNNDHRLARDTYALSVLLASRRDLKLIVARRDAEGNPLAPSRLLFAAEPDVMVDRAQRFFGELPPAPPRRNLLAPTGDRPGKSLLAPPRPKPLGKPISELSVTRFRDFIACPYRFYLRHVLALESLADQAAELDGAAFGNLIHQVLEHFGRDEDAAESRASSDPKRVLAYLEHQLDRIAAARYGPKQARPAVVVQMELARMRLRAFADWQAQRTRDGWRIVFSEDSEDRQEKLRAPLVVDGRPFDLCGRIDRIDYHETARKLCVVDYKTADRGEQPEKMHRKEGRWIDLQLPLYRHLVRQVKLGIKVPDDAGIELGYILVPRDLTAVGLALADWDQATLESADETAREIVRAILAEQFWPPVSPPPDFFDDVAVICQDRRMGGSCLIVEGDAA
jgi:RecB family exonuclease